MQFIMTVNPSHLIDYISVDYIGIFDNKGKLKVFKFNPSNSKYIVKEIKQKHYMSACDRNYINT